MFDDRPTRPTRILFVLAALTCLPGSAKAQIERISRTESGVEPSAYSTRPTISADGRYVAFQSASPLVAGAHAGCAATFCDQIYMRDRLTDALTLVSVNDAGQPANDFTLLPGISADGRFVVFVSSGSNLVAGDTNGVADVFVRDRLAGTTTRASVASDGTQLNANSYPAAISGNGRYVLFASRTSTITPNPFLDQLLFLHDRDTGQTSFIDVINRSPYTPDSRPSIDHEGRYIAYPRSPSGPISSGPCELMVFDRVAGRSSPVAAPDGGTVQCIGATAFDASGRYLVLQRNLQKRDRLYDTVSVWDRQTGTFEDITLTAVPVMNLPPAISADGRWVAFTATEFGVGVDASPGSGHLHVHDRLTHQTMLADLAPNGEPGNGGPFFVALSSDGSALAFSSVASDLVPDDRNWTEDVFVLPLDADGDGMPTPWEIFFGLNPRDARDAALDSDADGRSNAAEFAAGTNPRASTATHLAEGAVGDFFDTTIAMFNASDRSATVVARFMTDDGRVTSRLFRIGPERRLAIDPVSELVPRRGVSFSAAIEADVPLVVSRTMAWSWDRHAETASEPLSTTWYLAEGATHSGFELFYLLENPEDEIARVTIDYLLPSPRASVKKQYDLPANSRTTIWVNQEAAELTATDVAAAIASDVPITVERAMYLDSAQTTFSAGHVSQGVTAPQTQWFFAEGATGPFFDMFVLVANPGTEVAKFDIRYLLPDRAAIERRYEVAPRSRLNIWVNGEDARLARTSVAITLTSVNGVPVVADRAMWWPAGGGWTSAHASHGISVAGHRWIVAHGECIQGIAETYLLISNTSRDDGRARVTIVFNDGTRLEQTIDVAGERRTTIPLGERFGIYARSFSIIVDSVGDTPADLVVEASSYSNVGDAFWASGTNVGGTPDVKR